MADTILPLLEPNLATCVVTPDAVDFRRQVLQHGARMLWEKYVPCPCSTHTAAIGEVAAAELDSSKPLCPYCKGTGAAYFGAQQVPAMGLGLRLNTEWYKIMGSYAHGNAMLTLLPEHTPGVMDRFTLLDSLFVFTETRVRKAAKEMMRYPIIVSTVLGGTPDALTTPLAHTTGVHYVLGADASGDVTGEKVEGTHFTLYQPNTSLDGYGIDWSIGDIAGTSVPVGGRYTIRYYARPRYVVVTGLHSTRAQYDWGTATVHKVDFPVNFLVTLEHLGSVLGEQNPGSVEYQPAEYA